MTRNEMITEILNLYDQVDMLNQKLSCRNVILGGDDDIPMVEPLMEDPIISKLIEFGKQELAKKVTDSWGGNVQYKVNDDGIVSYTKYEVWLKGKFRDREIPDNMSKNEVLEYCSDELHAIYENERLEAERNYKESLEKESETE